MDSNRSAEVGWQLNQEIAQMTAGAFLNKRLECRRIFAETWGTFLTVLVVSAGAAANAHLPTTTPHYVMAFSRGALTMCIIYFMGTISGAHLNPAVTFAFALRRNFPWSRVPGYLAGQLVGSLLAVLFVRLIFGGNDLGPTVPGPGISPWKAVLMEAVITTGLVNTILGTASGARNIGTNGAIAVGSYVAVIGAWCIPITGSSMNPFRSLAPDILRGNYETTWIYFAGPLAGAVLGVAFEWILKGKPTPFGNLAAQGTGE